MIKSPEEIAVMRKAGEIAGAMMAAAQGALAEGVPEYEAALAVINAGTRKAAGFLTASGWEAFISPMIHNLQIMQSGPDTTMVHRRASVRPWSGATPSISASATWRSSSTTSSASTACSSSARRARRRARAAGRRRRAAGGAGSIREGVIAEDVAAAANEVYRARGFEPGYRTGRSIGVSYLEAPELKDGDKTMLKAGMTFAVDGGISIDGKLGGRIGDSIVVTKTGFEYLTEYPRGLLVV